MRAKDTNCEGSHAVRIEYTDKPVSGWGGLILAARFFDGLRLREWLGRAVPDGRRSNNRIPVVDQVLSLFCTVLTGGRRFSHVERMRTDEVIRGILGVERIPSSTSLTRYFGGFVRSQVEHLSEVLGRLVLGRMAPVAGGEVLDLDSTVFERYGEQEGSLKGHNPRKHGRPSHHPILVMLANSRRILHAWLRSGNTGTARGMTAFLTECLARLPEGFAVGAVRADSGFFVHEFLEELERLSLDYAIAVRVNPLVRKFVLRISNWRVFGEGLEVGETLYEVPSWKRPRRLVVVREEVRKRPKARGRELFEMPDYKIHVVMTSLSIPGEEVWRFYNGRADSENRLKELKYDFGADGFCLDSFDGTEAVFRLICFLYNLMADFKETVLGDAARQLGTVRHHVFVTGAILGQDGRRKVLRLGLRGKWRTRFASWLRRTALSKIPTATHPDQTPEILHLGPQHPWRSRPTRIDPCTLLTIDPTSPY